MTALMVCMRFFCFIKDDRVRGFEDLFRHLQSLQAVCHLNFSAHFGVLIVEGWQAVHELDVRVAGWRSSRQR